MQADDDKTRTYVPLTDGTMVSHYRIIEKIGAGGMGEVYLAEDTELNRRVALKFLPLHLCQDADCRGRFKREAQAAAKLGHANIVAVYEVGDHQGRPFFAMELVEGRALDKIVAAGRMEEAEIVELVLGVCNGLRKAHESGVIHRDIKPSNIIIDRDNVPRLLDFGLATIRDSDSLTQTGSTLGTIGYMSPEQVSGKGADSRSDLFSLGVVLYEMITGVNPFRRDNQAATLKAIADDEPQPLSRHRSGASEEIQRIVSKLLEKKLELRYQTAADLAADLRKLAGKGPVLRAQRGRRWYVGALVGVITIGVVAGGYYLIRDLSTESDRKTLAVLPFKNLSAEPDQEFFSDGLTEELTSTLSQIQSLSVVSRSSAMTFKSSQMTIPEMAKALKVQYIVEGSVRRAGKELRITAQLIDASHDAHLWSRTYSGTLDDVFDMQDSVSRAIVDGIKIQLTPDETNRLGRRAIDNPLAYEYYLRGSDRIRKGTKASVEEGMRNLQQGLEIVGENALIYSGLSWGHWNLVNGGFEQEEGIARAGEYARKALRLDPELPEAHAMLGWINTAFLGKQQRAVEHFKRALSIDSTNESALRGLMIVYMYSAGRPSEALKVIERYQRVYPLDSITRFGQPADMYYCAGDFAKALEGYRKMRQTGYRNPVNEMSYALTLAYCDSTREALAVLDSCLVANPTGSIVDILKVMRKGLQKDGAGALRELTPEARLTCRRDGAWSYYLGSMLAMAGAREEALDWLDNAVNMGCVNYPFMEKDPFLDGLRGDERFQRLLQRVKREWESFKV
jgi:non-specific serine/threonine protein kinase